MMTPTTILGSVRRIDFDTLIASIFRFAHQLIEEGRPRSIADTLSEAVVMQHAVDGEIFYTDETKLVDDAAAVLVDEVLPFPFGTLMDTRHNLAVFAPLWRPFGQFGVLTLDLQVQIAQNRECSPGQQTTDN